jgi:hypothetical protein
VAAAVPLEVKVDVAVWAVVDNTDVVYKSPVHWFEFVLTVPPLPVPVE